MIRCLCLLFSHPKQGFRKSAFYIYVYIYKNKFLFYSENKIEFPGLFKT